ncbi:virulence RhuM family protein [Desulfococcaceae bacterium OttesenSCG-928-F15]|nr:virulence RhuM family protein [Desulfococcaceae bacterium OttesenSCG-928-F15]
MNNIWLLLKPWPAAYPHVYGGLDSEAGCHYSAQWAGVATHAGQISHQVALDKAALEYEKYKECRNQLQAEDNLRELERDLKGLDGKS